MEDLRDCLLSSYDYVLSPDRIAQEPADPRHSARLLIVEGSSSNFLPSRHMQVWDLKEELRSGDLLVLNNTRVMKARLRVSRVGGGLGELLLLEAKGKNGQWLCLARPAKRMNPGDNLWLEAPEQEPIPLKVIGNDLPTGGRIVEFPSCYCDIKTIAVLLNRYGEVPLPPYIDRHDPRDTERYQTTYAVNYGAIAAPTAGLHLSDELLEVLKKKGVFQTCVTLHIGLGTFRPIQVENLTDLKLHSEWVEVTEDVVHAVKDCRARGGRVLAVGTTSVRALEGAFLAGKGKLKPLRGNVDLVIQPGYKFGVVDGLLTNFHLPKSSLLLLVSALIGRERLMFLYREAIKKHYRFFSYGDAMWISPEVVLPLARP